MSPSATLDVTARGPDVRAVSKTPAAVPSTPAKDNAESALLHRSLVESPHTVVSASGCYLTLDNGRKILDGCAGASVAVIGHGNEEVMEAAIAQMRKVSYVHTLSYTTESAEDLAKFVLNNPDSTFEHGLEKAYFVCSGSEANDAAMKVARQYFFEQGQTSRKYFVARQMAYHGNTIGPMSLSSNIPRKVPYEGAITLPYISHVTPAYAYQYQLPSESEAQFTARLVAEVETEFLRLGPQNVIGFVAEPLVGATTGCVPSPKGYFPGIRKVCDKYGILLMLDEVMCGMGRTGTLFACEQDEVVPDIMTIAKGLGGGYAPLAGILIHKKLVDVLRKGTSSFNHGHTYQAHPLSCAIALKVQQIVRRDKLIQRCAEQGALLEKLLEEAFKDSKYVGNIRGRGLFQGIEFVKDRKTKETFDPAIRFGMRVQQAAFDLGVAVYPGSTTKDGVSGDHVIISPPLTVTDAELGIIVEALRKAYDSQEKYVDSL